MAPLKLLKDGDQVICSMIQNKGEFRRLTSKFYRSCIKRGW